MNNTIKILITIAILLVASHLFSGKSLLGGGGVNAGADFFTSATNTTSSVTRTPAVIVSRDPNTRFVSICPTDGNPVYVCLQTATSTCVTPAGIPIGAYGVTTSTNPVCFQSATYKGDIVGVVPSTATTTNVSIVKSAY